MMLRTLDRTRTRRRFALILGGALAILVGLTREGAALTLSHEPIVSGPTVTLGDLFLDAGAAASVPVAAAPAPGLSADISAAKVASILHAEGLNWTAPAGSVLRVRRASRILEGEELRAAIATELAIATGGRNLDVAPLAQNARVHLPTDSGALPAIDIAAFDDRTGRFEARIAPIEGEAVVISGIAREMMDVPVLRRSLARGEIVSEADIAFLRLRIDTIAPHIVTDAGDLVGFAAKRPLRTSVPVQASDIERPVVVAKGALVALTYEVPGLALSDTARALSAGGVGDVVPVINLRSHRTVMGTVIGPDTVRVDTATPRPINQAALAPR